MQPVRGMYPPKLPPPVLRGSPSRPKLNCRFMLDVSILDGTVMTPSVPFTKIWRMKNNGNVVWPSGSQLVWIGGDVLSKILFADVEVRTHLKGIICIFLYKNFYFLLKILLFCLYTYCSNIFG